MEQILPAFSFILLYGISYGLVLFVIAIGLVVTLGLMRVANLAHGVFAVLGGYITFFLINRYGIPFMLAASVAIAAVIAFGLVLERTVFFRLYAMGELEQVLTTIGFCFVAIGLITLVFGPNVLPVRLPDFLNGTVGLLGRPFPVYRVFVAAAGVVILIGLWLLFDYTNFGAILRAAVDNQSMASATGINVKRYFSLAFSLGAGLAALGGIIGAGMLPLEPLYPFKHLPLFLTIVALAGFGNIKASALVALVVGIVDTAGRYLLPDLGAFTVYTLLVALILWRPHGLIAGWK